jgi:hypothetical protein
MLLSVRSLMPNKTITSKKSDNPSLTRADLKMEMVNYIGPIFEELKHDIRNLKTEVIHEMKILLERDERLNNLSDVSKAGAVTLMFDGSQLTRRDENRGDFQNVIYKRFDPILVEPELT